MEKLDYNYLLTITTNKELNDYLDNKDIDFSEMVVSPEEHATAKRWGFEDEELKLYVLKERIRDLIFTEKDIDLD